MSAKGSFILISVAAVICGLIVIAVSMYDKIKPSTTNMDLYNYYKMSYDSTDSAVLILQDEISSEAVFIDNNLMYIEKSVLPSINSRFCWDDKANKLIVITPSEYITVDYQSLDYDSNGTRQTMESIIMKQVDGKTYVSLPFITKFCNIEYKYFEKPNRLVLIYKWNKDITMATVKSQTELRYMATSSSDILSTPKVGDKVTVTEQDCGDDKKYTKVATEDGLIGYMLSSSLNAPFTEKLTNNYKGDDYDAARLPYVSMGWFSVAGKKGNSEIDKMIKGRTGMNVVSPTWFAVSDENGSIRSFGTEECVTTCHNANLKVWPTVNDFDYEKVSLYNVIKDDSKRKTLIDNIIKETLALKCDGVNIDFEHITKDSSASYIRFLREITVECHKNNLTLSVDSYVPVSYRSQYKLDEMSEFVDYVVIMAYDEYGEGSKKAGPTSSIKWVKTAVDKTLESVPNKKVVIGIPFFMRYWKENSKGTVTSTSALSMSDGIATLKKAGVKASWDESTGQYFASYKSGNYTCKLWLESASSVNSKLEYIMGKNVAGAAYWRLGYEDVTEVWDVIDDYLK